MKRGANWGDSSSPLRRTAGASGDRRAASRAPGNARSGDLVEPPDIDDIDPDELREFMSGELTGAEADPGFRERLRGRLWEILRMRAPGEPGEN